MLKSKFLISRNFQINRDFSFHNKIVKKLLKGLCENTTIESPGTLAKPLTKFLIINKNDILFNLIYFYIKTLTINL